MISKQEILSSLILGMLGLICSGTLFAQSDFKVELITTKDGLSQGMIYDVLQDREGFLWLATKDGLNRYDGHEFKVFTNDPNDPWSISENTIIKLFEDSAGRIWAASNSRGINIYDKKTGRFHQLRHDVNDPASLSGNHIDAIIEDSSGYFIVKIAEKELNMFRLGEDFFTSQKAPTIIRVSMPPQEYVKLKALDGFRGNNAELRDIVQDRKGRIWIGGDHAIYQLNVKKAEITLAVEGYTIFSAVADNEDGSIWASSIQNGIYNWDGTNVTPFFNNIRSSDELLIDKNSTLWVVLKDILIGFDLTDWTPSVPAKSNADRLRYRWVPTNSEQPLDGNYYTAITIDRSGVVWIGLNGFGLNKVNPNTEQFSHNWPGFSVRNIVTNSEGIYCIQDFAAQWFNQDKSCFLASEFEPPWGCVVGNVLSSKTGDSWIRYESSERKGRLSSHSLSADAELFNVLKKYNPRTKESLTYELSWDHNQIQPFIEAQDGSIWLAGENDVLSQLDPITEEFLSYDVNSGEPIKGNWERFRNESVDNSTALMEDREGVLWVGTERGFTKCIRPTGKGNKLQVTAYKNIPGDHSTLNYNHVTSFLEDPIASDRFLWISTQGGGLNRLDKKTGQFIHVTQKDGLPDNVVYGILADDEKNIWGSTNKGLFCMSQHMHVNGDKQTEYVFRNFSKADGLQENEFNTGAYAKLPDGKLAFGGINGYNVFDPKNVLTADFLPPVYITKISVNNQVLTPNDPTGILDQTIETTKHISLSHLDKILTLEFAALDFTATKNNKYRYQLVGADDNWVEAGKNRSATFLNLPPGAYTFRVQGSNSQGIWSEQIAELQITILPPWWKSWWAYLIYFGILAAGFWAYFRISVNRAKLQQQLEFEKRESDRVKDLDALKTQLFMNMTHEFRTPLTIIMGMAKQVQENPKEYFNSGMKMISRNGQHLLNLVNKMLDLSKLESGKMTLNIVQGDIVSFQRTIVESFRSYAANKEIQLHFLPEMDVFMMDFDKEKLQQVVSNLISNAFKFTPDNGHIYFAIKKSGQQLSIHIKDTGRGIPAADQANVFDRFYQVDNSTTRQFDGTGIGLALCKELVHLMKGKINVQSPPTGAYSGTEFIVTLPISQETVFEELPVPLIPVVQKKNKAIASSVIENIKSSPLKEDNVKHSYQNNLTALKDEVPLILLVEDNPDVVAYVASCLSDYRLVIAENGEEGFDIATDIIPDLIISDVMMPIMDGFVMCKKIKTDERTNHIPVIMLTARADMDSKIEGLELGANAYLPKPYEKQELLLSIKNLFDLRNTIRKRYQAKVGISDDLELTKDQAVDAVIEDEFVTKVRVLIERHIDDFDLTVEQLADAVHLSPSQLRRKLDALIGYSPKRFIRFLRLKRAKTLLIDKNRSVISVSYDCGFSDASYFTRVFKKEFGMTPVEWRAEDIL